MIDVYLFYVKWSALKAQWQLGGTYHTPLFYGTDANQIYLYMHSYWLPVVCNKEYKRLKVADLIQLKKLERQLLFCLNIIFIVLNIAFCLDVSLKFNILVNFIVLLLKLFNN